MNDSWKLTLPCTRAEAEALNDDIGALALLDPPPTLVTLELEPFNPDKWEAHAYFQGQPDPASIALLQAMIPSAAGAVPRLERLPDEDWLILSQQGIEPVVAGRFYVHTASNLGKVPPKTVSIRIDAGLAFGTGGHETTEGCLHMIDGLKRRGARFDHIVDIGTGTGLLAIAAHHLWPRAYVTASDIDPVSVGVSIENCAANGIALGQQQGKIALCVAPGTDHEMIQRRAPYDLVIANILAGPLIELAPALAAIMVEGGSLILAGILTNQMAFVCAAYRKQGLRLASTRDNKGWPCLRFVKRTRRK
jgi:ribosomal protein L11 methyltransferase